MRMRVSGAAIVLLLLADAAAPASAQTAAPNPATGSGTATGVITPPAQVDPGIKVKPPMPQNALPTPVIPPPGTVGGNPAVQPK